MSNRILDILPIIIKNKNTLELQVEMQALKDFINQQSEENLSRVKMLLGIDSIDKKQAKLLLSILNVKDFLYNPIVFLNHLLPERLQNITLLSDLDLVITAIQEKLDTKDEEGLQRLAETLEFAPPDRNIETLQFTLTFLKMKKSPLNALSIFSNEHTICSKMQTERDEGGYTNFNWGDIHDFSLGVNKKRGLALKFTPKFLKDYFRTVSTDTRKVKTLRAGHAHKHRKFRFNGKIIAETLPVSGGLEILDIFTHGIDYAQIITINGRIKNAWLKQTFQKYPDDEKFTLSLPKPHFYQKDPL